MTKRQIMKHLIDQYQGKKVLFGDHDFEITANDRTYHILFIKVGSNTQVTVNSKTHIEVATGKLEGIRFKKRQSTLLNLRDFSAKKNKIIYLLGKPFRILKYLNESDIVDISKEKVVHDYHIFSTYKDFETL